MENHYVNISVLKADVLFVTGLVFAYTKSAEVNVNIALDEKFVSTKYGEINVKNALEVRCAFMVNENLDVSHVIKNRILPNLQ